MLQFSYSWLLMVAEQSSPGLKFGCLVQVILINFPPFHQREREAELETNSFHPSQPVSLEG